MGQEPDKCPKEGPDRSLGGAVLHAAVSPQQLEALLTEPRHLAARGLDSCCRGASARFRRLCVAVQIEMLI